MLLVVERQGYGLFSAMKWLKAHVDIALATRQVLGVPGIHQKHFQTLLFENFKYGHPINACRLHGHTAHPPSPPATVPSRADPR